jgi:hypothetical protein
MRISKGKTSEKRVYPRTKSKRKKMSLIIQTSKRVSSLLKSRGRPGACGSFL